MVLYPKLLTVCPAAGAAARAAARRRIERRSFIGLSVCGSVKDYAFVAVSIPSASMEMIHAADAGSSRVKDVMPAVTGVTPPTSMMSLFSVIGTWHRVSTSDPFVLSISKTDSILADAEIAFSKVVVEKLIVAVLPKIGVTVAATVGTASEVCALLP